MDVSQYTAQISSVTGMFTGIIAAIAGISLGEVKGAADAAYAEYAEHMSRVRVRGGGIIAQARAEGCLLYTSRCV